MRPWAGCVAIVDYLGRRRRRRRRRRLVVARAIGFGGAHYMTGDYFREREGVDV